MKNRLPEKLQAQNHLLAGGDVLYRANEHLVFKFRAVSPLALSEQRIHSIPRVRQVKWRLGKRKVMRRLAGC